MSNNGDNHRLNMLPAAEAEIVKLIQHESQYQTPKENESKSIPVTTSTSDDKVIDDDKDADNTLDDDHDDPLTDNDVKLDQPNGSTTSTMDELPEGAIGSLSELCAAPPLRTKSYRCSHCPAIFNQLCKVKRHEYELHGIKACHQTAYPQCVLCPLIFSDRHSLSRHMRNRHKDNRHQPYLAYVQCEYCPMRFAKVAHLTLHKASKHDQISDKACKTDLLVASKTEQSPSDAVTLTSVLQPGEDRPIKQEEGGDARLEAVVVSAGPYRARCTSCTMLFASEAILREHQTMCRPTPHQDSNSEPLPSPSPSATSAASPSAPRNVTRTAPSVNGWTESGMAAAHFRCALCPEKFLLKGFLVEHTRQKHAGHLSDSVCPYACSYCGSRFQQLNHKHSHEAKCPKRIQKQLLEDAISETPQSSTMEPTQESFDDSPVVDQTALVSWTNSHLTEPDTIVLD